MVRERKERFLLKNYTKRVYDLEIKSTVTITRGLLSVPSTEVAAYQLTVCNSSSRDLMSCFTTCQATRHAYGRQTDRQTDRQDRQAKHLYTYK